MSEVGLDEGGILEALSKPIYTRAWTEYVYGRTGVSKGKVVEEIRHEASISLTTLLGAASLPIIYKVLQTMLDRDILGKVGTGENMREVNQSIGSELDPYGDAFMNETPKGWLFMPFNWMNTWKYHSTTEQRDNYRNKWGLPTTGSGYDPGMLDWPKLPAQKATTTD